MKKLYAVIALIAILGNILLATSCKSPETIKIKLVSQNSEYYSTYCEEAAEQEQRINQYLEERGKEYRLAFEVVLDEKDGQGSDISECDIVFGLVNLTPTELEKDFLDLREELMNGRLQTLYDSMPEKYWESVSVNGHIYNTTRSIPEFIPTIVCYVDRMEKLGIRLPEESEYTSFESWAGYFEEIFKKNDEKPFLAYLHEISSYRDIMLPNFCWNSNFRMITSYLGIEKNANDNLEVRYIYDSDYEKKQRDILETYNAKGYIEWGDLAVLEEDLLMDYTLGYNPFVVEYDLSFESIDGEHTEHCISYPLQNRVSFSTEPADVNKLQILVRKDALHLESVCKFLNDMASDYELLAMVVQDKDGNNICNGISPNFDAVSPVMDMYGVYESLSLEENLDIKMHRYDYAEEDLIPEFVFDSTPVEKQVQQVESAIENFNTHTGVNMSALYPNNWKSTEDWLNNWDAWLDEIEEDLYQAGLQDIIDEANRQVRAYSEEVGEKK